MLIEAGADINAVNRKDHTPLQIAVAKPSKHCVAALVSHDSCNVNLQVSSNDVLFIAGLVAYWPARIHDVALLDLYCLHVTSGRLAVCYSQIRSIFSSATAFTTAKLR